MGLLKSIARVPWNLLKPLRERAVFRLLHYGRVLLQPLEAELGELKARLQGLEGSLRALEDRLSALDEIDGRLSAIATRVGPAHELAEAASRRLQEQGKQLTLVELGLRAVLRDLARARPPGDSLASPPPGPSSDTLRPFSDPGTPPSLVSYARNGEDLLLARLFPEDHVGFYVDAGAGDPALFSVTRLFYDRGWRGINAEPSRPLFDRLVEQRPRDVNLNVGLWDADADLDFHENPGRGGSFCFREEETSRAREQGPRGRSRKVKVVPLAKVLEAYEAPEIDFLKVDVEGAELEVLRGNDWARFRPRALVIEAGPLQARPERAPGGAEDVERLLAAAGYTFATFDGTIRFYVRNEDAAWVDRLRTPPNDGGARQERQDGA